MRRPSTWLRDLLGRGPARRPAPHVIEPSSVDDRCAVCGHERRAHEHLRRGSDCALCDCLRFRS